MQTVGVLLGLLSVPLSTLDLGWHFFPSSALDGGRRRLWADDMDCYTWRQ
jgi:hypothetical protein